MLVWGKLDKPTNLLTPFLTPFTGRPFGWVPKHISCFSIKTNINVIPVNFFSPGKAYLMLLFIKT